MALLWYIALSYTLKRWGLVRDLYVSKLFKPYIYLHPSYHTLFEDSKSFCFIFLNVTYGHRIGMKWFGNESTCSRLW